MRAILFKYVPILWWLLLFTIPFMIGHAEGLLRMYRCPAVGDCYDPAALAGRSLGNLRVFAELLLWPPCLRHLGGRALVVSGWRRIRGAHDA